MDIGIDYGIIINNFFQYISDAVLKDFIAFLARHPEISVDNCVLLFLENEQPLNVSRYFRDADEYIEDEPEGKPMAMLMPVPAPNDTIRNRRVVMYPIAEDPVTRIPVRKLIKRAGYEPVATKDINEIIRSNNMLIYPITWNDEQTETGFLNFFIDLFYDSFSKRYSGFPLALNSWDWKHWGRDGLLYMATIFYEYSSPTLSRVFFKYINQSSDSQVSNWHAKRFRITSLWFVFLEFIRITGHGTSSMFENEVIKFLGEDLITEECHSDDLLLDLSIQILCERHALDFNQMCTAIS